MPLGLRSSPPASRLTTTEGFASLYAEHSTPVLLYLLRRVPDPEVATDLMAETFAQALVSRAKFRGTTDEQLAAWLFAIARHQLTRFVRRGKAERKALQKLGLVTPSLTDSEQQRALELAATEAIREAVATAMSELSADQRDALHLRVVEELGYPEVAMRLGISNEAARARVHRGLRTMARRLHGIYGQEGIPGEL